MGHIGSTKTMTVGAIAASGFATWSGFSPPDNPPVWNSTPAPVFIAGVAAQYAMPVTDADGDVVSLSWVGPGAKPAWLSFSGTNIVASGAQVDANDVFNAVVRATSNALFADSPIFNIIVNAGVSWNAVPAYTISAGVAAGPFTLPVTTPNGASIAVAWVGPGTKPAWVTLTSGVAPTIAFTGAQADANDLTGVVISAAANSQTANSGAGTITVNAIVVGSPALWETTTLLGNITLLNHASTPIVSAANPHFNSTYAAKHTRFGYRASTGRLYTGYGDSGGTAGRNVDGWTDIDQDSENPLLYSIDPAVPNVLTREVGDFPNDTSRWVVAADEGAVVYDSVGDRLIVFNLMSNGLVSETNPVAGTPEFLTPTSFRMNGSGDKTTQLGVGVRISVFINHPQAGTYRMRGRVASRSFDAGTNSTTVNVTWDPGVAGDVTFQAPTSVFSATLGNSAQTTSAHAIHIGAASVQDIQGYWKEATGAWYNRLAALNLSGNPARDYVSLWFRSIAAGSGGLGPHARTIAGKSMKNGVYIPATATAGRGAEIHSIGQMTIGSGVLIHNLQDMTVDWAPVSLSFTGSGVHQGQLAFDGTRYVYFIDISANGSTATEFNGGRLHRWDVLTKTLTTLSTLLRDEQGVAVATVPTGAPSTDKTHCVWNEELNAVEIYTINSTADYLSGKMTLYLFDPSDPAVIAQNLGQLDNNGVQIFGRTMARGGRRTLMIGDDRVDQWVGGNPVAPLRAFIGGNLKFAQVTAASHPYHGSFLKALGSNPSGPTSTDAVAATTTDKIPEPAFGGWYHEVDSNGLPTGVLYGIPGGDGDYSGNEVTVCRLDQLSGTVFPASMNLTASTAELDGTAWHKRSHTSYVAGGTTAQPEIVCDPNDFTNWQPMAQHNYTAAVSIPGVGLVVHSNVPPGGVVTPETNVMGGSVAQNPEFGTGFFGTRSFGINTPAVSFPATGQGLRYWSRTGANAGKWQVLAVTPNRSRDWVADYNITTGKLVGGFNQSSGDALIWEWSAVGGYVVVRTITGAAIVGNTGGAIAFGNGGSFDNSVHWLTGDQYLVYRVRVGMRAVILYNHATGSAQQISVSTPLQNAFNATGAAFMCHVDRVAQKVWYIQGFFAGGIVNIFKAPIGDPGNAVPLIRADAATFTAKVVGSGLKNCFTFGGFLYFLTTDGGNMPGGNGKPAARVFRVPTY